MMSKSFMYATIAALFIGALINPKSAGM